MESLVAETRVDKAECFSGQDLYFNISETIAKNRKTYWPSKRPVGIWSNSYIKENALNKIYDESVLLEYYSEINLLSTDEAKRNEFIEEEEYYIYAKIAQLINANSVDDVSFSIRKYLKAGIALCANAKYAMHNFSIENVEAADKRIDIDFKNGRFKEETYEKRKNTIKFLRHNKKYISSKTRYLKGNSDINSIYDNYSDMFSEVEELSVHCGNSSSVGLKKIKDYFELFSSYQDIQGITDRLKNFEINKNINICSYDIIQYFIRKQKKILKIDADKIYEWEFFWQAYFMNKLYPETIYKNGLLFIDEFQDFSKIELELIKDTISASTTNYFGDFNQCITSKGITEKEFKGFDGSIKRYNINENYRNPLEVTKYVNKRFKMNMLPVGIQGEVEKVGYEDFFSLSIKKNDRVALIVKDISVVEDYIKKHKVNVVNTIDDTIKRGVINIMPVSLVKGLEFETVGVVEKQMTNNEKYVSMTRSLNSLYLVGDKYNKDDQKDDH